MKSIDRSDGETPPKPADPLLRVTNVHGGYGAINVIKGISLKVLPGEVVAILGLNGAGKTTLVRLITGLVKRTAGSVSFGGGDVSAVRSDEIVRRGLCMVPEGREIFGPLTVTENLDLGAYSRPRSDHRAVSADRERVYELFPILRERGEQKAGTLSGGQQQMLAIGRALMSKPRLLILDEPSLGISPKLTGEIFEALRRLNEAGLPLILIEQNVSRALDIADRVYIIRTGTVALQAPSNELRGRADLDKYYLGE